MYYIDSTSFLSVSVAFPFVSFVLLHFPSFVMYICIQIYYTDSTSYPPLPLPFPFIPFPFPLLCFPIFLPFVRPSVSFPFFHPSFLPACLRRPQPASFRFRFETGYSTARQPLSRSGSILGGKEKKARVSTSKQPDVVSVQ